MAGRVGFNGMEDEERFVNNYHAFGHSGYFERQRAESADHFMQTHWLPLLCATDKPKQFDCRTRPTALGGLTTFLLNNAEPVKLALYVAPVVALTLWVNGLRVTAERQKKDLDTANSNLETTNYELSQKRRALELALNEATETNSFVKELLRTPDPFGLFDDYSIGANSSGPLPISILDRGAASIAKLRVNDTTKVSLLNTLGTAYLCLGKLEPAERIAVEASSLWRKVAGPDETDAGAFAQISADTCHLSGVVAFADGDDKTAIELLRRAIDLRGAHGSELAVAQSKFMLAWALADQTNNASDEAEKLFRDVYEARKRLLGISSRETTNAAVALLANLITRRKDLDVAALLPTVLQMVASNPGSQQIVGAVSNYLRSAFARNNGEPNKAIALHYEAIKDMEGVVGATNPFVAAARAELAGLLLGNGEQQRAEEEMARVVDICKKSLPRRNRRLINGIIRLGEFTEVGGDKAKAATLYRDAWERCRGHIPYKEDVVQAAKRRLTAALTSQGLSEDAAAVERDTW
jgi:tetratricopeptide (TPR) repeat protein